MRIVRWRKMLRTMECL